MILQISLTVSEAKQSIAHAASTLPEVEKALEHGKILLKGGTTVSLFAQKIINQKLRICGRITPMGTKGSANIQLGMPHSIVIKDGEARNIDDTFEEEVLKLGRNDIFVTGANAIDIHGNAALMAGSPLGGKPGRAIGALVAEGINVLILAGLEKLIPISIDEAARACGRKKIDIAFGAAVGLVPIVGKLITEQAAIGLLADIKSTVIGSGGVCGAEGATTMVIEGDKDAIKTVYNYVQSLKNNKSTNEDLVECVPGSYSCKEDLACIYKRPAKYFFGDNEGD